MLSSVCVSLLTRICYYFRGLIVITSKLALPGDLYDRSELSRDRPESRGCCCCPDMNRINFGTPSSSTSATYSLRSVRTVAYTIQDSQPNRGDQFEDVGSLMT